MKPDLKIVQFPVRCGSVSESLRKLADSVDAGEFGDEPDVVIVLDGNGLDVRGFGHCDGMVAIALLDLGRAWLVNNTLKELEE